MRLMSLLCFKCFRVLKILKNLCGSLYSLKEQTSRILLICSFIINCVEEFVLTATLIICSEDKCKRSQKFAAEADLPALSNLLLPKTRGFSVCFEALHNSLDAVYDLTIAYKPRCPSFMDNVFGTDPSEVHIHVRRVLAKEIPANDAESCAWLMDSFQLKDKLLNDFSAQGQFPNQRQEEELSILKCVATFGVVVSLTGLFVYLTLYSHCCFKVYVGLSFWYLSFATYYKFRPSPPVGCCCCRGGFSKEGKED